MSGVSKQREEKGRLDDASMAAGGLHAPAIAVLKAQGVDHLAQVEALGQAAWSHLFRSGLTLGDQRALVAMIAVYNERPLAMPPPPNLAYNVGSILIGLLFAAPSVAIGVLNGYSRYTAERALSLTESFTLVLVPGGLYLIVNIILVERYRSLFSTDVLEQRSDGISIRDAERSALTNMAVVAALLLTIIIGALLTAPAADPSSPRLR